MNEKLHSFCFWAHRRGEILVRPSLKNDKEWEAVLAEEDRIIRERIFETMPSNCAELRELLKCSDFFYAGVPNDFWRFWKRCLDYSFSGHEEQLLSLVQSCMEDRFWAVKQGFQMLYRPEMLQYYASAEKDVLEPIISKIVSEKHGLDTEYLPNFFAAIAPIVLEKKPHLAELIRKNIVRLLESWKRVMTDEVKAQLQKAYL